MKKGDRVSRVISEEGAETTVTIVGTIARNKPGAPYPFLVKVDLDASTNLPASDRAWYISHYAGPYNKNELELVG